MTSPARTRINLPETALRLARQQALWRPLVAYDQRSRYYVRLAAEPDFEAWLLTWLPGQGTEWHDHGGSAGAFAVLQGTLTERHATTAPGADPRVHPAARQLPTDSLRPFGTRHIHRVTNEDGQPAVSLHVYAPASAEMNHYEVRGDRLQLITSQVAGVNW